MVDVLAQRVGEKAQCEQKTGKFSMRMTEADLALLDAASERYGLSRPEIVRALLRKASRLLRRNSVAA